MGKIDIEKNICDTLIDMMEAKSFFDISVSDLVKAAKVSRSSFYLYFNSIYDVLQKIEDEFTEGLMSVQEVADHVSRERHRQFDQSVINRAEYIKKNKKILKVLTSENGDPSFLAKLTNRNKKIVKVHLKEKVKYSNAELKILSEYMAAGQLQAFKWWVNHEEEMDIYDTLLFVEDLTRKLIKSEKK